MASSNNSNQALEVAHEDVQRRLACIQLNNNSKNTTIEVHGGVNAIGNNARIIINHASVEPPSNVWWMVPKPVSSFTGRMAELEQLHDKVMNGNVSRRTLISDNISAVTGLGGIGKTELAKMYAHLKGMTDFCCNVVWINAEDTSAMTSSFYGIAEYLGIDVTNASNKQKNITTIVTKVYDYFRKTKALFIFDNAETLSLTRMFLPCINSANQVPYILLTSRNQEWGDDVMKLQLDILSQDECVHLINSALKDHVSFEITQEDALTLAERLHYFPLALQQAIAYIKKFNRRRKFMIPDYLDAFESKTREVLDFKIPNNDYTKTVYLTWQVTFDKLQREENSKLALEILSVIAYLQAENIPFSTFLNLANDNEDDLWDALEILEQFCLIRRLDIDSCDDALGKTVMFNVHRLVQTVLRLRSSPDEAYKNLEKALTLMERFVQGRFGNYDCDKKFLYHAMMVWEHGSRIQDLLVQFVYLPVRMVDALLYQGRYQEALDYARKQHSFLVKNLHAQHHAALALEFNIARALHCLERHQDALVVYEEVFQKYEKALGALHCDTLAVKIDQAFLYVDLQNPEMSLKIFEEVYEKKKQAEEVLNDVETVVELYKYRDIITVLYGIAHSLQLLKRYSEAVTYYRIVYDKRRLTDGEDNPRTLHIGNKMAESMLKSGQLEEAHRILSSVYCKQKKFIGENHPHTLMTESNLADCLKMQGKTEDALNMLVQLYERKIVSLGRNHKILLQLKKKIEQIVILDNQVGLNEQQIPEDCSAAIPSSVS